MSGHSFSFTGPGRTVADLDVHSQGNQGQCPMCQHRALRGEGRPRSQKAKTGSGGKTVSDYEGQVINVWSLAFLLPFFYGPQASFRGLLRLKSQHLGNNGRAGKPGNTCVMPALLAVLKRGCSSCSEASRASCPGHRQEHTVSTLTHV